MATEPHEPDAQPAETEQTEEAPPAQPVGGALGGEQESLLRTLSESEIPDAVEPAWGSETNQDHMLGNLNDAEVWERKFNLKNNHEFVLAMCPPEESVIQGEFRKKHFDFLPGATEPLNSRRLHELADSHDAAYARVTRSRNGWQQEQLAKQIQEMIQRDGSNEAAGSGSSDGGWLQGLLGGGR